jgi:hypothetical protein
MQLNNVFKLHVIQQLFYFHYWLLRQGTAAVLSPSLCMPHGKSAWTSAKYWTLKVIRVVSNFELRKNEKHRTLNKGISEFLNFVIIYLIHIKSSPLSNTWGNIQSLLMSYVLLNTIIYIFFISIPFIPYPYRAEVYIFFGSLHNR